MSEAASSMIRHRWQPRLEGTDLDEVRELVALAAEYDAEAGFSDIGDARVRETDHDGTTVRHLPIRARLDLSPDDDHLTPEDGGPMVVVAYLHLAVDQDGLGTISYVVHPEYRSRGLTTLLVEQLGLDVGADGGWVGTGARALRCWAYSTHPAAERLTRRFGIDAAARQWTVVRHLSGPFASELDAAAPDEGVELSDPRALAPADTEATAVLTRAGLPPALGDRIGYDLEQGGGRVIVARADGEAIGMVWYDVESRIHMELRAAPIRVLVVDPEYSGRSVGTALMTAALHDQRSADVQLGMFRIDPDEIAAVRMCRLLGFEQEDAHSCYQIGTSGDVPSFR